MIYSMNLKNWNRHYLRISNILTYSDILSKSAKCLTSRWTLIFFYNFKNNKVIYQTFSQSYLTLYKMSLARNIGWIYQPHANNIKLDAVYFEMKIRVHKVSFSEYLWIFSLSSDISTFHMIKLIFFKYLFSMFVTGKILS